MCAQYANKHNEESSLVASPAPQARHLSDREWGYMSVACPGDGVPPCTAAAALGVFSLQQAMPQSMETLGVLLGVVAVIVLFLLPQAAWLWGTYFPR